MENIEGHILEFLSIVRSRVFSKVEPDRVILFNGRFYNYAAVYIIANFLGIPLFILEQRILPIINAHIMQFQAIHVL